MLLDFLTYITYAIDTHSGKQPSFPFVFFNTKKNRFKFNYGRNFLSSLFSLSPSLCLSVCLSLSS